ncbi:hypothetical protein [Streptomyces sp. cg36]|uniref:hypothetical protein n=1 Tax=Streptomyces sp. cg36 TaxID=3238798 RepID=UPI0034E2A634
MPQRPAGVPESQKIDFPPVRNGIDYLIKSEVGPRDIKYAVLHSTMLSTTALLPCEIFGRPSWKPIQTSLVSMLASITEGLLHNQSSMLAFI